MNRYPTCLVAGAEGIEKSTSVDPSGMQNKFSWLFDATYGVICSFFMAPINARVVRRSFVLRNEHNRISYAASLIHTRANKEGFGLVGRSIFRYNAMFLA